MAGQLNNPDIRILRQELADILRNLFTLIQAHLVKKDSQIKSAVSLILSSYDYPLAFNNRTFTCLSHIRQS